MSTADISKHAAVVKRVGKYLGARYLRNQGVPFEVAHVIVLGVIPRALSPAVMTCFS